MLRIIQHFFKFQFLIILISIIAGIYYPEILDTIKRSLKDSFFSHAPESSTKTSSGTVKTNIQASENEAVSKDLLFTKEELWKYNGADDTSDIYISILGSVFDVTRGRKHYGNGCTYNAFAGRDASASFITGNFETFDENSDHVAELPLSQIWDLNNWRDFYHKDYKYKGKLIGRYYDQQGKKTKYHHKIDELIVLAKNEKDEIQKEKEQFPHCNIEWKEETGTRVWCTNSSGGIDRSWTGVPRKYFDDKKNSKEFRCACINEEFLNSKKLREYENCDPQAVECFYRVD